MTKSRSLALALPGWHLGRNPIPYGRLALLVWLTTGLGAFALTYAATLEQSFVDRADVHRLIAAAAASGHAETIRIDFRPRQQVVDGAHVLIDLQSRQRQTSRPQCPGHHFAVVFPQRLADAAFARTQRIDHQHEEP